MKLLGPVLLRAGIVFVALLGLQFLIIDYVLVALGLLAGGFIYKTSDDRPLALGMLLGSVAFGVFAWFYRGV